MKTAFLFSGQGAQKPGMGMAIAQAFAPARDVFARAEMHYSGLTALCFEGPSEELNQTANTQPCLVTTELALLAAALHVGFTPCAVAGFSLGEIAALTACGVFTEDTAVRYAVKRGKWMADCALSTPGSMAAVLGADSAKVSEWCAGVTDGWAEAVNHNAPGQIVVAGDTAGLSCVKSIAADNGAKCIPLRVSGAFHSRAMKPAVQKLETYLSGENLGTPKLPWYPNVAGAAYASQPLASIIASQTASPVLFEKTVRAMALSEVDAFVEIGPGSVLCGLIKRIVPDIPAFAVEDPASLETAARALL